MEKEIQEILSLLTKIDQFRAGVNEKFERELALAAQELYDEIMGMAERLTFGPELSASEQVTNRKKVLGFRSELSQRIEKGLYGKLIIGLAQDVTKTMSQYVGYFGKVVTDFRPDKKLYQQVIESGQKRVIDALTGANMEANVTGPVINLLERQVAGGQPLAKLRTTLKEQIVDRGLSTKPIKQLASDAVEFTVSDYIQTVSKDVGLKHYLFQGTIITTTRSYCRDRAGRVFTEKEVKDSAKLNWNGKIPGTDEQTIFIYRGGYACRHQYNPISKAMYDYLKGQSD